MINVGDAAVMIRQSHGLSQKVAAKKLGVTTVHLCNIEKNKTQPSASLVARYTELWGVDVYVLAWCLRDDAEVPAALRSTVRRLEQLWKKELRKTLESSKNAENQGSTAPK